MGNGNDCLVFVGWGVEFGVLVLFFSSLCFVLVGWEVMIGMAFFFFLFFLSLSLLFYLSVTFCLPLPPSAVRVTIPYITTRKVQSFP